MTDTGGQQPVERTIKVLLVEDHPVVRLGLQMLMESEYDMEVVGEAGTVAEAVQQADSLKPDVVLMDIGLPDGSGIDTTVVIKERHPEMAVVALTIHEDGEYVDKMFSVGASGYVSKRAAPEDLIRVIREATRDQEFVRPVVQS